MARLFGPAVVSALALSGAVRASGDIPTPSGQPLTLSEVLLDEAPGALWVRFRFIAPEIAREGGRVSVDMAGEDMEHLCHVLALPYLQHHQLEAERVVISLSDRVVPFGETLPDATQFFEIFTPENGNCIWEEF